MKQITIWAIAVLLLCSGIAIAQTIEATTPDGKTVILNPDGTWKYKETSPSNPAEATGLNTPAGVTGFTKPAAATEVLKSNKGYFELWYNPAKWKPITASEINRSAEFALQHTNGDAYAMAIVERISMPVASLKKTALENAKKVAPDANIAYEEDRVVNGVKLSAMRMEFTIQDVPYTYYGYYWGGDAGSLQVVTYTGRNLFKEYESDLTDLLNGVVITKP
jgi:hypothetical protein